MINPCINLYRTLEEATTFKDCPYNETYIFGGIHLLPRNPIPYIQVTNTPDGINLEDWTVKLKSLCGSMEADVTSSFMVTGLTNSLNGDPQIIWSLTNVTADFGIKLSYLEVTQDVGETFYSEPFLMTDYRKEQTTQFHYKYYRTDALQSIGFKAFFTQYDEKNEITTYYETSTQSTVSASTRVNLLEKYSTEMMSFDEVKKLSSVLRSPYLYVNLQRGNLYEAPTFPQKKGNENFGMLDFTISPKSEKLNL